MMLMMLITLSLKTADVLLKIRFLVMVTHNYMCRKLLLQIMMSSAGEHSSRSLVLVLLLLLVSEFDLIKT